MHIVVVLWWYSVCLVLLVCIRFVYDWYEYNTSCRIEEGGGGGEVQGGGTVVHRITFIHQMFFFA